MQKIKQRTQRRSEMMKLVKLAVLFNIFLWSGVHSGYCNFAYNDTLMPDTIPTNTTTDTWYADPYWVKKQVVITVDYLTSPPHYASHEIHVNAGLFGETYAGTNNLGVVDWKGIWLWEGGSVPFSSISGTMIGGVWVQGAAIYNSAYQYKGYSNAEARAGIGVKVNGSIEGGSSGSEHSIGKAGCGVEATEYYDDWTVFDGLSVSLDFGSFPPNPSITFDYSTSSASSPYHQVDESIDNRYASHDGYYSAWSNNGYFTGLQAKFSVSGTNYSHTSYATMKAGCTFTMNSPVTF
jgi:hypothetical protein